MTIKAVLFDNDGTLVDTERAILESFKMTMKIVFNDDNPDLEKYRGYIGLPLHDQFINYADDKETIDKMVKTFRQHNGPLLDKYIRPFDGLSQALEEIDQMGIRMGVVTSKVHELTLKGLDKVGISQYFSYVQGADDWHVHKPDPGALSYACEQIGLEPNEVMYVGDSPYDIKSGNGAGCVTAAVLWGVFSRDMLSAQNPDFICSRPSDLVDSIKELN